MSESSPYIPDQEKRLTLGEATVVDNYLAALWVHRGIMLKTQNDTQTNNGNIHRTDSSIANDLYSGIVEQAEKRSPDSKIPIRMVSRGDIYQALSKIASPAGPYSTNISETTKDAHTRLMNLHSSLRDTANLRVGDTEGHIE